MCLQVCKVDSKESRITTTQMNFQCIESGPRTALCPTLAASSCRSSVYAQHAEDATSCNLLHLLSSQIVSPKLAELRVLLSLMLELS